jgi:hypothetical protein
MLGDQQFLAALGRLKVVSDAIDDGRALFLERGFERRDLCLDLPDFYVSV